MMRYLEDEPISTEELAAGLKQCVADGVVVPVLVGSATMNRGVAQLLDAIVELLPSAAEVRTTGTLNGSEVEVAPDAGAPTVALAFKTMADPHVGRVTYFRVYSGAIKSNTHAWNATRGEDERLGQLFYRPRQRAHQHRRHRHRRHRRGGQAGLGDDRRHALRSEQARSRSPASSSPARRTRPRSIPRSKTDLDKMGPALQRLVEEDPTLRLSRDSEQRRDDPLRTRRAARADRSRPHDPPLRRQRRARPAARAVPRNDLGQDRRRVQAQEADRRRRPVRPRLPRAGAAARRRLRIQREGLRWIGASQLLPGRRKGRPGGHGVGTAGRLSRSSTSR